MEPYIYNAYICNLERNIVHCSIDCGFSIHIDKTLPLYKVQPIINKTILKELKNKIINKRLSIQIIKEEQYQCILFDNNENINEWIHNYTITLKEAIKEHGIYLGMTFPEDNELLWIAKASLEQELPPYWIEGKTKDNRIFYSNSKTKESAWEHPCDELYREMYKCEKSKQTLNVRIDLEDIMVDI